MSIAAPEAGDDGPLNLHASALVIGEQGVLVRGPSGSGKTRLALALVAEARRDGLFARLVADDRTLVSRHGARLVARPHPRLSGLVERRGIGIVPVEHEPACVLRLAVDLIDGWPARMPEPDGCGCEIAGVPLARLTLGSAVSPPEAVALVLAKLNPSTTTS